MAADILIVDDEADIRDLVAGILQDEGYDARTARNSDEALGAIVSRRPNLVFLDIWLQGSRARRPATARRHQAGTSRIAGGDDLRPRQHRNRGRRHQARRLRLHREAVQGRPAGAGGRSRAGNLAAASARSSSSSNSAPISRRCWSARSGGDRPVAPDHREGGADQQPHSDRRPVRLRQGTGRAHDPSDIGARERPVHRHQRRRDHA